MPPHCLLPPLCHLLPPLHWSFMLFRRYLTPLHDPLMPSSCLIISLWWCLFIKTLLELDYPVKVTPRQFIIRLQSVEYYVKIIFDLDIYIWPRGSPQITKIIPERYCPSLIVENHIFAYLTLKLTHWPWKWPIIIKIVAEMDYLSILH